ncbi:MAG: ornithine carbamoyltransferase [Epsilonproteobacteria bacterium]|nr:ornithine carbamoyltransferase [Campylobacterota bacterium]MBD3839641.1 ornithine carbamoyltransferase [Campylobacterota bacterium]
MKHFLSIKDFNKTEILEMIALAQQIKDETKAKKFVPYLKNQTLGMIFEKSSTRTRVSFEVGIYQLGGVGLFLSSNDIQLGRGEPLKDTARVISRMVDMVMIRTFEQSRLDEFAKFSQVPLINGLSTEYHPVQIMTDYFTLLEIGISSPVVAYIGDGNNIAHSWLMLASKLGLDIRVATPVGYECDENIIADAQKFAQESGATITFSNNPSQAVKGVDVVITDTWVSMGQESEKEVRIKAFADYKVDSNMMSLAKPTAVFMHCLPAYRDYEVSEEIFEQHSETIFLEAENRLHMQKGIMVWLNNHRND